MPVSISKGNAKMGAIQSVSLPSGVTCRVCECNKKCYARRLERRRKSVREAYRNNLEILTTEPDTYWREVEAAIMLSRYFRFHVSGDIPDATYLWRMVEVARRKSRTAKFYVSQRSNELVNDLLRNAVQLPSNLHMVFSAWRGLNMENPFNLPEAHVRYRDGTTTAREDAKECGGNCVDCAIVDDGCWSLKAGEQVVFNEH